MNDLNRRQRISELQTTIMNAENELLKLRSECTHPTHHAAMYMWRVGGFIPSWICDVCDASIPGITEEESKTVWDSWHQGTSSGSCTFFYNIASDAEALQTISTTSGGEKT